MRKIARPLISLAAIAGAALFACSAEAKECSRKAASGTGVDAKSAKFQVDEALLQATNWGAWAAYMASGTTPGYSFGPRSYSCSPGGLGTTCKGSATICKL